MSDLSTLLSLLSNKTREDEALVTKAFEFAQEAHEGQKRKSGEPYFVHCFETAKILAELGMSATVVAAGLLHDTIEDTSVTREVLEKEFGDEILFLVEGVTKLGTLRFQGLSRHAESLRKLFVASSKDVRVVIIKLADRLHNIRTLEYIPKEKQERIARETLEIYAPLAYRLGIRRLTKDLEDEAFPFVYPEEYERTLEFFRERKRTLEQSLDKVYKTLKRKLAENGLRNAETAERLKGMYSLYKKLVRKKWDIEAVRDLAAIRVVVPTVDECYKVLGIVHSTWRPLPGRVKDYIAFPKPNGYQSIHTDVFTGDGGTVEIQIRTEDMHNDAEFGVASHLLYKEGVAKKVPNPNLLWLRQLLPRSFSREKESTDDWTRDVPEWIKELNDYQEEMYGAEFLDSLKNDFMRHRIFVFTPKGDVVDLPTDSTAIDFAYAIHTEVGNHTVAAKINGKLSALDTLLKNGDIVEVSTKSQAVPNKKWLDFVKTALAKKHIRNFLEEQRKA